jgi:5-bromo-4-chloroindolyl phosphate hydrolysis protein
MTPGDTMTTRTKNNQVEGKKLSDKDIKELVAAIAVIRAKLPLIALAMKQKMSVARADDETIEACRDIAAIAAAEPAEFPKSQCDGEEMTGDFELYDQLNPLFIELRGLTEDFANLILALRSDILRHGFAGYAIIQRLSETRPELLKSIDKLSAQFAKRINKG